MAVRFCPQCGVQTVPEANFCAECGEVLRGAQKRAGKQRAVPPPVSRSPLTPGIVVLASYLVVGIGLWVFVLRSQPFPTVAAPPAGGAASTGGSALPQDHPAVTLPEEVTQRIAELANTANAAPQDVSAWKTLAEVQFRASQIDASYRSAALASYRRVLELAPKDLDALRGIGNVYYDFEEHEKAIQYYQQYLALDPDNPSVRTDLGTMYLYRRDIDRAIAEYQAVIARQPDFFQAYVNLGIAYQERGESAKAREALTRARSLTTNENVRTRIDQILAQFAGSAEATVASTADRSSFQQAIENLFRSHDIMGPRIVRIEWSAPAEARVFFQNFPMAGMPPEVRERFLDKLRTQVTAAKSTNGVDGTVTVEFVDIDTNQVMSTMRTAAS